MKTWLAAFGCLLMTASLPARAPQAGAERPADTTFYAVSYVEVISSSPARMAAVSALKQYREASRRQDGYVRVELFEQIGRPGHFALVETWRDQSAFDGHISALRKSLLDSLQTVRVSGYDERPYKTLSVGPPPAFSSSSLPS